MMEKWDMEYWCELSSRLRRKFGEGKYLLYISTGKTFLYISFLHFCIVLANYKYLLEERGEGTSLFDSTYASEKRIDREKLYKSFLKFKHAPALDYKLDIFRPFVSSVDTSSPPPTTLLLPLRWRSKNGNFTPSANSSVARKGSERVVGKDGDSSIS